MCLSWQVITFMQRLRTNCIFDMVKNQRTAYVSTVPVLSVTAEKRTSWDTRTPAQPQSCSAARQTLTDLTRTARKSPLRYCTACLISPNTYLIVSPLVSYMINWLCFYMTPIVYPNKVNCLSGHKVQHFNKGWISFLERGFKIPICRCVNVINSSMLWEKIRHIDWFSFFYFYFFPAWLENVLFSSCLLSALCSVPALIQNPEEGEVRLRSYSYSSPKARPSRPLLNRDATITDLAEGEWTLNSLFCGRLKINKSAGYLS